MIKTVIFVCLLQALYASANKCPDEEVVSPCSCSSASQKIEILCNETSISETKNMVQRLPSGLPVSVFAVVSSDVNYIRRNFFGKAQVSNAFFNLSNLDMIHDQAFQGQENSLKSVSFVSSQLAEIPTKQLKNLRVLQELAIVQSPMITKVEGSAFEGFKSANSFRKLYLDSNSISSLQNGSFANLPRLSSISLHGNELTDLNPFSLPDRQTSLTSFSAASNQLTTLSEDFLKRLSFGTTLDVSNNRLTELSRDALRLIVKKNMQLDVYGNKLNCNCNFATLVHAQNSLLEFDMVQGQCHLPANLKSADISSLTFEDLPNCLVQTEDFTAVLQRNNAYLTYMSDQSSNLQDQLEQESFMFQPLKG